MAAPYSNDLREKVLIAVDGGMSSREAGQIFSIHRKTIEQG
jgi:transposase